MSFIKKLRESKKILDAAREAIEQYEQTQAHIAELNAYSNELMSSTKRLIDLHRQLMDNMELDGAEVEREIEAPLQVVTTHGTFPVGSPCPQHKTVHSNRGTWYICVDNGFVDVTGWHPEKMKG